MCVCSGFRHDCGDACQAIRGKNFTKMRRYVIRDRKNNDEKAESDRLGTAESVKQAARDNEALARGSGAIDSDDDGGSDASSEER